MEQVRTYTAPFQYAGFYTRVLARVIDKALIFAATSLTFLLDQLGANAGLWPGAFNADAPTVQLILLNLFRLLFFLGFPIIYYVYLHGCCGQTFGKMIMGIIVINDDGTPLGYKKAVYRQLGYYLCELTFMLGYFWAAIDSRKQGLHDKVVGTFVIYTDDP